MRWLVALLFCSTAYGASTSDPTAYIYEGSQALINISGMSGTTNMNACDDCISGWSPDFGFDFDLWGNTYRKAKMSTNGCVNFSGLNCSDYTPQPLPYRNETLYPFWTDLIRNNSSKMLFKSFDDYVVFGWYGMKEYQWPNHRGSNNFETILWENDTYEYRYGALDIANHDVLIGEQHTSSVHKTFRYFDDGTGGHSNWDSFDASFSGNVLEGGGSLYSASLTELCNANPLYSTACSGYAAAYLAQQCGISALYDSACSGYAAAYLAQQCGISALYNSSCTGYAAAYLSQQCNLDATYDSSCDGYWEATFVATVADDYTDVIDGDDVSDYYFVDDDDLTDYYVVEIDVVEYDSGDDTYDDGSNGYSLDGTDQEDTWMGAAVVMVDDSFSGGDDSGFDADDGVDEFSGLPVIEGEPEEIFEEVFEEVIVEVFEEVVVVEESFEEPEEIFEEVILEEPEEIAEEIFEEEPEEVFEEELIEEELIAIEEVIEEEPEAVIEVVAPVEEIAVVEEELVPEIEEPERAAVNITKLALSIVAETSAISAGLTQSAISQTTLTQSVQSFGGAGQNTQAIASPQTFSQGTFSITPTPEAALADTSFASEAINETQTAALAEVGIVFNSGSMQLAQLGQTDIQQSMDSGGLTDVFGDTGGCEPELEIIQGIVSTGPAQNFNPVTIANSTDETAAEEVEVMQELSVSVTEMQFEDDFNDAIATGQTIGQFLSNQLPDFGQFDVAPPSVEEQQTVRRAENAIESMSDAEIQEAQEAQLEGIQDSGGFDDQSLTILLMGRVQGMEAYNINLVDQQQWYQDREIYGGNAPVDGNVRALQGQGAQTYQDLVGQQYEQ